MARRQPAIQLRQRHFPGQNAGEQVIWIKRQSKLFLLASAWPVLLAGVGLAILWQFAGNVPGAAGVLQILGGLVVAALVIRWGATGLWNWTFQYYILTDQRVIRSTGYFHRDRAEIPLKTVAQVRAERPNPLMILFGLGNVAVRPLGPEIHLTGVRHPRELADSILAVQEHPPGSGPPPPPAPQVRSPKIQAAINTLAQQQPMPPTPLYTRRRIGAFMHRKIPIRFFEGETEVEVVYRHWFVLVRNEVFPALLVAGGVGMSYALRSVGTTGLAPTVLLVGGVTGGVLWALFTYLNYADDVFVLTTQRVIDIDRLAFILAEYSNDAPYARIQNVRVERNIIGRLLGYGSIVVQTSGRANPLKMEDIPHAFRVMDHIFEQINQQRERDSVAAVNKQKKENNRWLATVINEMLAEVPDVRGLPLLEATARLRGAGLRLVVESEVPSRSTPPGRVLDQTPSPGTTEISDNEVRVVLSGHGMPVAPTPPLSPAP